MANVWDDLGIVAPASTAKGAQVTLRIDADLIADLATVENALRARGYSVSRSEIIRASSRALVDSILEALELPKSETQKPAVTQRLPKIGGSRRVHA
ncbi:hypothetical protein [Microbacterium lacticum]|uniref:hypothetical protein n=1 Tax=Microbacterium lacticum TaxID=33885 RepID=UPI00242D9F2D|nr:hypothetical protein [Microbacterium lacticum]